VIRDRTNLTQIYAPTWGSYFVPVPKEDAKKTPLFNQDFNDALTFAENDLKTNWESYKKRFLEGMYDE